MFNPGQLVMRDCSRAIYKVIDWPCCIRLSDGKEVKLRRTFHWKAFVDNANNPLREAGSS